MGRPEWVAGGATVLADDRPSRRASNVLERSTDRILRVQLDVKDWLANPPSVSAVRPGRCPACGVASRPVGACLAIHGHGRRERVQLGPRAPDGGGEVVVILVRRYRCCSCGAVITVVPRGLIRRRLYAAAAISLALGLWGLVGLASPAVRTRVSPNSVVGDAARHHWATLGRWVAAGAAGRLSPRLSVIADEDRRVTAGRLATALIGFAPPGDRHLTTEDQLYLGGARAA